MENFLDTLSIFFERSGFFFVPILSLAAFFNLPILNKGRGWHAFMMISLTMLAAYIFINSGSSRYVLIPLLLFGMLSAAGVTAIHRYTQYLPFLKKIKQKYWLILATAAAISTGLAKIYVSDHVSTLGIFTNILNNSSNDLILYSAECTHGIRLGGELRNNPHITFCNLESWNDVASRLAIDKNDGRDIYIYTAIPEKFTTEDLAVWFRGKYGIFPFEEVAHTIENRSRRILLKFNFRTLDGVQSGPYSGTLASWPDTLQLKPYRTWALWQINDDTSGENQAIYITLFGTMNKNQLYFRKLNNVLEKTGKVELRNQLGFPEEERTFTLQETTSNVTITLPAPLKHGSNRAQLANDRPLLLDGTTIYASARQEALYLHGAIPHWSPENSRINIVNGPKQPVVQGKLQINCQDTKLKTAASATYDILRIDTANIARNPLKLLWIDDQQSKLRQMANQLQSQLHAASSMEYMLLPQEHESAIQTFLLQKLPDAEVEFVFLNIFSDPCVRPWTLPINVDPFMDKHLSSAVKNLHKKYPSAQVVLILPPPPAAGTSLFPPADSVVLGRLAHYNLCGALQRWHKRHALPQVSLLPLYFFLDPYNDYMMDSPKVWSGNALRESAYKKSAENIAAFLVYQTQTSQGEKK